MMKSFSDWLRSTLTRQLIGWGISKLSPWLVSGMTALAGTIEGVQWTYVIPLAAFTFCCTAGGVLLWNLIRDLYSANEKLHISKFSYNIDLDPVTAHDSNIKKMQFGFYIENRASFRIYYIVDELYTSIEGRVNNDIAQFHNQGFVEAGSNILYRDSAIVVELPAGKPLSGIIRYKLRYGREGNEIYLLTGRKRTTLDYDVGTRSYNSMTCYDIATPTT